MNLRLALTVIAIAVLLAFAITLLAGTWRPVRGEDGAASSIYTASATWCAPTKTQCQSWGGNAKVAAVNGFRFGDDPYWVRVARGSRHVDVLVNSFCACSGRHDRIDLSPAAFRVLSPLSRGRIDVTVETIPESPGDAQMREEVRSDALYTLPPTSTEDGWTP